MLKTHDIIVNELIKSVQRQAYNPYKPLSPAEIDLIHETTMEVFSEIGFKVHLPEIFEMLRKMGASVDSHERIVRIGESIVMELISSIPSELTLYARKAKHNVHLGTGNVYFGTGGTALNVLDYETDQQRAANLLDLVEIVRLVDHLDNIHLLLIPTYPNDLPIEKVDINRFFTGLANTEKHIMGGIYTSQGIRDVIAMAEIVAGSAEALREKPFISMITCGISPLVFDSKYGALMIQVAKENIPLAVPVEPLCGATAPITLAGNLVIQNCDALIHLMTTQMVNPGAPVLYGCVATSTDLRDLNYLGGPVESGMINAATAQLAQHYGIPYYATAGISDSKILDVQSGYESAVNNLLVALAGADFIHDAAGLMEFAMTVSKEKLVIDNEILGMVQRAVQGIEVNKDTLALDVIRQAGPGGNFTTLRHTRKYMRKEHYFPKLSDREKRQVWEQNGKKTTKERAHEEVERILSEPHRTYIPTDVIKTLTDRFPDIESVAYNSNP